MVRGKNLMTVICHRQEQEVTMVLDVDLLLTMIFLRLVPKVTSVEGTRMMMTFPRLVPDVHLAGKVTSGKVEIWIMIIGTGTVAAEIGTVMTETRTMTVETRTMIGTTGVIGILVEVEAETGTETLLDVSSLTPLESSHP